MGALLEPARPRPSFTLRDLDGAPFDFAARTGGRVTFLFFGYTNCPDVCPTQMATLTGALRSDPSVAGDVVFVTTDPVRDTPDRMREWLSSFDYPVIGLTGTADELTAAQVAAGLAPAVAGPARPDGSYDVGHAAQVLLITPDDQIHLAYPLGVRRDGWLHDLRHLPRVWRQQPGPQPGGGPRDGAQR